MSTFIIKEVFVAFPAKAQKARNHDVQVIPVYFTDVESKSSVESAKLWAANKTPSKISLASYSENKPMKGLTFDYIEERAQGGRAVKVFDKNGFYFDVREDQLAECIIKKGISKGGVLGGEWVIAKSGSQTKIILVDGEEYKKAIEYTKKRNESKTGKKISASKAIPGNIYQTLQKTYYYAGERYQIEQRQTRVGDIGFGSRYKNEYALSIIKQPLFVEVVRDGSYCYIGGPPPKNFSFVMDQSDPMFFKLKEKIFDKTKYKEQVEVQRQASDYARGHRAYPVPNYTTTAYYNNLLMIAETEEEAQKIIEEAKADANLGQFFK